MPENASLSSSTVSQPTDESKMADQKPPLRILHVLLSRGFAGSERSTAESCNAQCQNNEVGVIIRKKQHKRGAGIEEHLDAKVAKFKVNAHIVTQWQLAKAIEAFKPDVIHCHLRRATRLVAKVNPAAATVSTLHIEVNGPHFMQMDGLVCNARWQIEKTPSDYKGKLFKACNSLTPHKRLNEEEIQIIRTSLGIRADQILIGAVGRYHASKGWDTLINAFRQVKSANARLLFFGSGSLEDELKTLSDKDKRIQFIGYRQDIKDLYQCFDLLMCPSRYEPLPRVMLEGMDAGVPIIASNVGGCQELVDDYGGQSFPVDDVDALAAMLATNLNELPARYRPDLSAHYVENANEAMMNFYRELIALKTS